MPRKYCYILTNKFWLSFCIDIFSFLFQLLDTGFFHADPHPGNLIRTPDGKLAILDFGKLFLLQLVLKYFTFVG